MRDYRFLQSVSCPIPSLLVYKCIITSFAFTMIINIDKLSYKGIIIIITADGWEWERGQENGRGGGGGERERGQVGPPRTFLLSPLLTLTGTKIVTTIGPGGLDCWVRN